MARFAKLTFVEIPASILFVGLTLGLLSFSSPANAIPCGPLYAKLSNGLRSPHDESTIGTAVAVVVQPDGKTQFFYRTEGEARAAAARMGISGPPVVNRTPKSTILAQDRMTIEWMDASDYSKPFEVEHQVYTLNLNENLWHHDHRIRQRSQAFNNEPTMGNVIAELNKVVDRREFDGLDNWVYALEVTPSLQPQVRELVGQAGIGNCFGTALCATGAGSKRQVWTEEFEEMLLNQFAPASGELQKGDVGVLFEGGSPIHAFTIIQPGPAKNPHDGWVLTKNGQGTTRPIHFQRQRESMAAYPESTSIRYFRRRTSAP